MGVLWVCCVVAARGREWPPNGHWGWPGTWVKRSYACGLDVSWVGCGGGCAERCRGARSMWTTEDHSGTTTAGTIYDGWDYDGWDYRAGKLQYRWYAR